MEITQEDVDRLRKLQEEIYERVDEFKWICRSSMDRAHYEMFKYRTLGHLEPAISEEHEWVTTYSSIDSLEKVVENLQELVPTMEEEFDDEVEGELEFGRLDCTEPPTLDD